MKQYLASAVVFALVVAAVAVAQDPPPTDPTQPGRAKAIQVQPKGVQIQPGQPGTVTRVTAARMATLEEEFETLDAHRDVKRAIVKAAEVAVKGAETWLELVNKPGVIAATELLKAKTEVDVARAQLEIRVAELREVEVKIKHAKKRLEDAKAGGVRPPPGVRPVDPKQVDPPPPPPPGNTAEELNKRLKDLQVALTEKKLVAIVAPVEARQAKEDLDRVAEAAKRGVVAPATIDAAVAKVKETQDKADRAAAELKKLEDEIAVVKAKLKELDR